MAKEDEYRNALRRLDDWEPFLLAHSGLPGPRANLELASAVADEGDEATLRRWAVLGPGEAPTGSTDEFLPLCGVVGLGRLAAAGDRSQLAELRRLAEDPRWRIREAVAIALQRVGDADFPALLAEMERWAIGTPLEQRAAVAALCEPRLLRAPAHAAQVLALLERVTDELGRLVDRRADDFRTLRRTLGYGWSVAVVAHPAVGKPLFERLAGSGDPDVRWIVRENLKKKRLERLDAAWVERLRAAS
jgi:HEAT repeat protein